LGLLLCLAECNADLGGAKGHRGDCRGAWSPEAAFLVRLRGDGCPSAQYAWDAWDDARRDATAAVVRLKEQADEAAEKWAGRARDALELNARALLLEEPRLAV
jgi:hypothetical protein